ncbi:MAG TPA: hypothetical protein VN408_24815 [Actinoplanes sp.]|nr:hypothetical protein [Actinoplanes sp.]
MVGGPVLITATAVSGRAAPGLLAVSVAALISIAAWSGRALFSDMSTALFLTGVIVPLVLVAGVAIMQRLRPATGDHVLWELTVRAGRGRPLHASLRTDAANDPPRSGAPVRVIPAWHAGLLRTTPDRIIPLRTVEILAEPDGPTAHRFDAASALPPIQRAGLALAVLLLAATVVSFFTA